MTTIQATSREVTFTLADAPPVDATAPYSGKERTISPLRGTVSFYSNGDMSAINLWGPQIKADGSLSAVHYEVRLGVGKNGTSRIPAPQWLVDLAETLR